jgi:hypothetical protein
MTKTYLIAGSTWVAEVTLTDTESYEDSYTRIEAATRGVEAWFKRRDDINVMDVGYDKCESTDSLVRTIDKAINEELIKGCGIGELLAIVDAEAIDSNHTWYIRSREILENVGAPRLIEAYNKKFPKINSSTT